jgi:hypothetical protein
MALRSTAGIVRGAESVARFGPKGKEAKPVTDVTPPQAPAASAPRRPPDDLSAALPPVLPEVARGDRTGRRRAWACYSSAISMRPARSRALKTRNGS